MTKLEKLEGRLAEAAAHRQKIAGEREAREKETRRVEAALTAAERRLSAKALVPNADSTEVDSFVAEIEELEARAQELRDAEADAAARVREAKAALEKEAFRLAPEAAKRADQATRRFRAALAEAARPLVEFLAKANKAEQEQEVAFAELRSLTERLRGAGPEWLEQVMELRSHLRTQPALSDEELAGRWVQLSMQILRMSGGTQVLLEQAGIAPLEGSVQEGRIAADRYELFHMRKLPAINV